jgi:hypothetical protein
MNVTPMDDQLEPVDPTPDDAMADASKIGSEQRLWLRSITAFLATRSSELDHSRGVQVAADMAYIAAFDRVARLCRGDEVEE